MTHDSAAPAADTGHISHSDTFADTSHVSFTFTNRYSLSITTTITTTTTTIINNIIIIIIIMTTTTITAIPIPKPVSLSQQTTHPSGVDPHQTMAPSRDVNGRETHTVPERAKRSF
ncbi:hypothetical protein IFR05_005182 [Cadophora sp. M221]|nr:hypothetical protein IFR05_005182 [Cadophora sp. M221]